MAAVAGEPALSVQMLDCGRILVLDGNKFSDTQGYDGQQIEMPVPCYIVRHGERILLWDAGLPRAYKTDDPNGLRIAWYVGWLDKTLPERLADIGLGPGDIDFMGISHVHFDHMGQAESIASAQLLIGAADFDLLFSGTADPSAFNPQYLSPWKDGDNVTLITGDHDVFGDGRVIMLATPGHTPGHHSLLIHLEEMGPIILSGDLYHFAENRRHRRMPDFNVSRADTLASMDRIEAYAKNIGAKMIIQHDKTTYERLRKGPAVWR